MKNVLKLLLTGMVLVWNPVIASENFKIKVEDNQVIVELNNIQAGSSLIFKDGKGEVLYMDQLIAGQSYKKHLNLEIIPVGIYYLNLDSESKILTQVINKKNEGLQISENSSAITFKPCYKIKGKQVSLFLSNPEEKRSSIKIYDGQGVLMETISNGSKALRKTLDFSKVPAGEYTVRLQLGNHLFERKVVIV